jgi:hypothetical protein
MDARTIVVVSMGTTNMLADCLTNSLPEPKHTMIFMHCMGAALSGDELGCIIDNDLEAIKVRNCYYIYVLVCKRYHGKRIGNQYC